MAQGAGDGGGDLLELAQPVHCLGRGDPHQRVRPTGALSAAAAGFDAQVALMRRGGGSKKPPAGAEHVVGKRARTRLGQTRTGDGASQNLQSSTRMASPSISVKSSSASCAAYLPEQLRPGNPHQ